MSQDGSKQNARGIAQEEERISENEQVPFRWFEGTKKCMSRSLQRTNAWARETPENGSMTEYVPGMIGPGRRTMGKAECKLTSVCISESVSLQESVGMAVCCWHKRRRSPRIQNDIEEDDVNVCNGDVT